MKTTFKNALINLITLEARLAIYIHKPKIIAVTGSVGKTSTKDAIYSVVSSKYRTRKSNKSENSEIGVPLTILGLSNQWNSISGWGINLIKGIFLAVFDISFPKVLVLEVGADHPGDIENITKWLKPDISVFTRMSDVPVHVEFFADANAVFEEKGYLAKTLKVNGTLILNHDDTRIMSLLNTKKNVNSITYGTTSGSDVRLIEDMIVYKGNIDKSVPSGINYSIKTMDGTISGNISDSLGRQHLYPILASIATGLSLDIPINVIEKSLVNHRPPIGRMKIIPGINSSILIDDTYNSSPVALFEALNTLAEVKASGKKIAVLGDMLELGKFSEREHEIGGRHAAKSADFLILVGKNVLNYVKGALDAGMNRNCIFTFDTSVEAGEKLKALLVGGDVALIKGSQGVRMEKIVKLVMTNPQDAESLLVRQEPAWMHR